MITILLAIRLSRLSTHLFIRMSYYRYNDLITAGIMITTIIFYNVYCRHSIIILVLVLEYSSTRVLEYWMGPCPKFNVIVWERVISVMSVNSFPPNTISIHLDMIPVPGISK